MSSPSQFYLGEHIPVAIVEGVRRRGIDVLTISEARKLGTSDEEHFAFARSKQRRVIVTHDTDFSTLKPPHPWSRMPRGNLWLKDGRLFSLSISL